MTKLTRIFLLIFLIICIVLSIGMLSVFYTVPIISDLLVSNYTNLPWISTVFAGYSALIILCLAVLMFIVLFFPSRSNFIIIKKEKGNLQFSKKTIESTAKYSFADIEAISSSDLSVKLSKQPDKSKITVKLTLNDTSEMLNLTENIQNRIEEALHTSLGISVKAVAIKVTSHTTDNKIRKDDNKDAATESRVI